MHIIELTIILAHLLNSIEINQMTTPNYYTPGSGVISSPSIATSSPLISPQSEYELQQYQQYQQPQQPIIRLSVDNYSSTGPSPILYTPLGTTTLAPAIAESELQQQQFDLLSPPPPAYSPPVSAPNNHHSGSQMNNNYSHHYQTPSINHQSNYNNDYPVMYNNINTSPDGGGGLNPNPIHQQNQYQSPNQSIPASAAAYTPIKPRWSGKKKCCVCCSVSLLIFLIVMGSLVPFLIQLPKVYERNSEVISCNGSPPTAISCYRPANPASTEIIARSYFDVDNGNVLQGDVTSLVSILNPSNSMARFGSGEIPKTTVKSRTNTRLTATVTFRPSADTDSMVLALYGPAGANGAGSGQFPITVRGTATVKILGKTIDFNIDERSVIKR